MIDQKYLREYVRYDPETGAITYKERPLSHFKTKRLQKIWNANNAHKVAGTKDSRGHIQIRLDGVKHLAHRIVFIIMTGATPKEIDHINRVKTDNSWKNLRSTTRSQNAANTEPRGQGVYKTRQGRYRAQICVNYKITHLGTFDSQEAARKTYAQAVNDAFGEYSPYQNAFTKRNNTQSE